MILLDTHAIVWLASDQDRFTEKGRALIRDNAGQLYVSVVSAWEISMCINEIACNCPWSRNNMLIASSDSMI